jgi:hypothetical protein
MMSGKQLFCLRSSFSGRRDGDMIDPARQTGVVQGYSYRQLFTRPLIGGGFISALSVPPIVGSSDLHDPRRGHHRRSDHLGNATLSDRTHSKAPREVLI